MHTALGNASPAPTLRKLVLRGSQAVSRFTDNLTKRMRQLGMDVGSVTAELNRRGISVAYSTVAGWLNGARGSRWNVDELQGLLEVLQTDLAAMAGHAELIEAPIAALIAKETQKLPPEQQQAILAMVKTMTEKP